MSPEAAIDLALGHRHTAPGGGHDIAVGAHGELDGRGGYARRSMIHLRIVTPPDRSNDVLGILTARRR